MNIVINNRRENSDDITVFWTLTDDNGNEYPWHGDVQKGVDIQTHLEANMEKYLLLIRNREYPDCPQEMKADLETMEEWIADGCMLRDEEGQFTGSLDPIPWVSTHPIQERIIDGNKISGDTLLELDALIAVLPEASVLRTILIGNQ